MQATVQAQDLRLELVDKSNISQLRLLNSVLFPIAYTDKFYRDCTAYPAVTWLAYKEDELAGAIACRLEAKGDHAELYIMTLGVLSLFRRQGIATKLVERVLAVCMDDAFITKAYLHVQCGQDDVLTFYKKLGFQQLGVATNYYKRLDPPDAIILGRPVLLD